MLEILVRLDLPPELLPDDYRLPAIDIPDDAAVERLDGAPPRVADCLALGEAFLDRGQALVLLAPSVVAPQELSALVNVRHPDVHRVRLIGNEAFRLDPRLLR